MHSLGGRNLSSASGIRRTLGGVPHRVNLRPSLLLAPGRKAILARCDASSTTKTREAVLCSKFKGHDASVSAILVKTDEPGVCPRGPLVSEGLNCALSLSEVF